MVNIYISLNFLKFDFEFNINMTRNDDQSTDPRIPYEGLFLNFDIPLKQSPCTPRQFKYELAT